MQALQLFSFSLLSLIASVVLSAFYAVYFGKRRLLVLVLKYGLCLCIGVSSILVVILVLLR